MGYMTDGVTFNVLRGANMNRQKGKYALCIDGESCKGQHRQAGACIKGVTSGEVRHG